MRRWRPIVVAETAIVGTTTVVGALISTSKGELVNLLLLILVASGVARKRLPRLIVAISTAAVVAFAIFSYLIRFHGTTTGRSDKETVIENIERAVNAASDEDEIRKKGIGSSIDRFSGIDGLALCMRKNTFLENNSYRFGSITEVVQVVPKYLWPTRPAVNFNSFVTHEVWEQHWSVVNNMPIGRIAESFYVLNWGGLTYAVVYAILWKWVFVRLYLRGKSISARALYISILFGKIFPDDNIMTNLSALAFYGLIAFMGVMVERGGVLIGRRAPSH
jgi:hypothetical protein